MVNHRQRPRPNVEPGKNGRFPIKPFISLVGAYTDGSATKSLGLTYGVSNALAASPGDLRGFWVDESVTLIVQRDGSVSGSTSGPFLGRCKLAGTVSNQAGTSENLFALMLTAQEDGGCRLVKNDPYEGFASIGFKPAGPIPEQGYHRILQFLVKSKNGAFFSGSPGKL